LDVVLLVAVPLVAIPLVAIPLVVVPLVVVPLCVVALGERVCFVWVLRIERVAVLDLEFTIIEYIDRIKI
jgi:hypothetical protein